MYRHPYYNFSVFQEEFCKTLKKLALLKQDYYIVGDINIGFLKCSNNQKIDSYRNDLLSEGCFNLIDKPTRVTANSSTSIDHLYTNNLLLKSIQAGILNYEISDHLPLFCLISYSPKMQKIKYTRRCLKKFNADRFLLDIDDLASSIYQKIKPTQCDGAEKLFNMFISKYTELINKHIPQVTISSKQAKINSKPWISRGILTSIKAKNKLFNKCYKRNKIKLIDKYKKYRNKLTAIIRAANKHYFHSQLLIHKSNPAKTWQTINTILEKHKKYKTPIKQLEMPNEQLVSSDADICEAFNTFFASIGPNLASKIKLTIKISTLLLQ